MGMSVHSLNALLSSDSLGINILGSLPEAKPIITID